MEKQGCSGEIIVIHQPECRVALRQLGLRLERSGELLFSISCSVGFRGPLLQCVLFSSLSVMCHLPYSCKDMVLSLYC